MLNVIVLTLMQLALRSQKKKKPITKYDVTEETADLVVLPSSYEKDLNVLIINV